MTPFLSSIANKYIKHEADNLLDYCFVFPNKRSGVFFEKYLSEYAANRHILFPKIATISDLINDFSGEVDASRYEQLFLLYNTYKSLSSDITDFDQFQFWGDMILNDFNDVDKYLVDAKQLFINIRHLKEINSNYLTPEQIEIINKYWGENRPIEPVDKFWAHLDNHIENDLPRDRFLKLWEILYELYVKFNAELSDKGLSYSGRAYRHAANNISKLTLEQLPFKRYIFIGFNVLSAAEIKILDKLKNLGCADFYWDYNPLSYIKESNKASRFIKKYAKMFPSRYHIDVEVNDLPEINIIGVPSNIGQVKEASTILSELTASGKIKNTDNAINTAIILPDENLFIPLIHSFPEQFKTVNITMGYPLRHTPISTLINVIISMHLRARIVKSEYVFYHEDIQAILSQPIIRAVANSECEQINNLISNKRIFNLSAEQLMKDYPHLKVLFTPVKNIQCFNDVFAYISNLIEFLKASMSRAQKSSLDVMFLARYQQVLQELQLMVKHYNIQMKEHTFFHLIERAVSSEKINFEGEPLKGLQIMGVLETRALDFDNLILLSMNERVFPRKHYARSFIPEALRRGYGMSTLEFQESIYAYYFYRLLTRAKNVYLLYDARTSGVKSGEMSRYLYQLKYLYPHNSITSYITSYDIHATHRRQIQIAKTPEILNKLNLFKTDNDDKKSLSASSIKTYVHCPLRFYLESVEELHIADDIKEYMDDVTYGNIVHSVVERIYTSIGSKGIITESVLNNMINNDLLLSKEITRAVNEHYNKLGKDCYIELHGEAQVLADIMKYSIKNLFKNEQKFTPIRFISAENRLTGKYKISEDLSINIKLIVDRIDKVFVDDKEHLRIVDYKTGKDITSISSFDEIFDNSIAKNNGAILQMFIYCNFYSALTEYDGAIQPILYKLRTLNTTGIEPLTIGYERKKQKILDYRDFNDDFILHFHKCIEDMFNPEIPFRQTQNDDYCQYCNFKNICGK